MRPCNGPSLPGAGSWKTTVENSWGGFMRPCNSPSLPKGRGRKTAYENTQLKGNGLTRGSGPTKTASALEQLHCIMEALKGPLEARSLHGIHRRSLGSGGLGSRLRLVPQGALEGLLADGPGGVEGVQGLVHQDVPQGPGGLDGVCDLGGSCPPG